MHVLIVEDEKRLREMLEAALPDMGFAATGARSAEDALRILEASAHQIVLLDLRLPGMNGLDFLHRVRDNWPATGVIILTGYGDLDAARQAIHLDVVEFLTKPAPLGDIEKALERARAGVLSRTARASAAGPPPSPAQTPPSANDPEQPVRLEDLEREHILRTLNRNKGNRTATATELGISLRTLYYRLSQYQQADSRQKPQ